MSVVPQAVESDAESEHDDGAFIICVQSVAF